MRNFRIVIAGVILLGSFMIAGDAGQADEAVGASRVEAKGKRVTIDVANTDITRVLDAFSQQTGISVVTGKDVSGLVSARLLDVEWEGALDAILKPNGFGYEYSGGVIIVLPLERLIELNNSQPLSSRVFKLQFRDAGDIQPIVEAQLSARGRVQILEETGQKGWAFGAFGASGSGSQASRSAVGGTARPRRSYRGITDRRSKSKVIVVSDIPSVLDRIAEVIDAVDVRPQQILIQARFMEVNRDRLKDIGVDFATGASGTSSATVTGVPASKSGAGGVRSTIGAQSLGSLASPSAFGALSSSITKVTPFNMGLSLAFSKLTGSQFDVLVHALEEDVNTNTLSAPSIMTLDNQEANILVGTQYPILTSSVAGTTSTTTVTSLDYYQDIGIQLRVVPQIAGEDQINMIVHPAVTSFTNTLAARSPEGTTLAEYPILITREAETQILMNNGETLLIGGLLKDVKTKGLHKVPLLGDIPVLGWLFQRRTDDVEKIELLIFITAHIADETQVASRTPVFQPEEPGADTKIEWKRTN